MMDQHVLNTSLRLQNKKLRRELEYLKMLQSLVKENLELRSRLDSFLLTNDDTVMKKRKKSTCQRCASFVDESLFGTGLIAPHRTSSPLHNAQSLSAQPDTSSSYCQMLKDPERVLGEIAFQLECRVLSHIFYRQTRLYGFTVNNIPEKIIQVSTHPLTGQVDEAYRYLMTARSVDLMDRLGALGYNMTHHPPFSEFIINTYGILKERPDTNTAREPGYSDLNFLRCVMVEVVPSHLLKDLLVLFSCLCYLVEKDGKPFILW